MQGQGGAVRYKPGHAVGVALAFNCSWFLPGIAPDDLGDADQR